MQKKLSKKDRVLAYLQTYGSITPKEAFIKFGLYRLGATIFELRQEGHDIETKLETKNGDRYARYIYTKSIQD